MHTIVGMTIKDILKKLHAHYGSDAKIGEAIGVNQTTINRLRKGVTEPSFGTYKALLAQVKLLEDQQ